MLEILTFTGVDGHTSLDELAEIAGRYPKVEFGILAGTHTDRQDRNIFPSLTTIGRFREAAAAHSFQAALHLCGVYSRNIMRPLGADDATCALCAGFNRIQINLHGDYWDRRWIGVRGEQLKAFADTVTAGTAGSVIVQHRSGWAEVPVEHPGIEYLFDVSEGGGLDSIDRWPAPPEDLPEATRLGFAGGLGPHNMARAMAFANRHADVRLWMDMEGRVRTRGWLDLAKVRQVCAIAFPEHHAAEAAA